MIIKEKLKTIKFLSLSLSLLAVLSACDLSGRSISPAPITNHNPVGSIATMTLQFDPTQTKTVIITPTYNATMVAASPMSTPISANAPYWSVYNYTCELAVGGATMTMNLAWRDRSNSEDGYKVYRDNQVIATLVPNSTSYIDVAFVATGNTLSYSVEAFNNDWHLSTTTITYACQ